MVRLIPVFLLGALALPAKEPAVVQKDFQRTVQPVFQKFCFDCHGENKPKAGIRVDYLDGTVPDKEVRHWEIIRKQLIEEEMPPEDEAQPSKAERAALVAWIDGALQMARTRVRPKNGDARRLTELLEPGVANVQVVTVGVRRPRRAGPSVTGIDLRDRALVEAPQSGGRTTCNSSLTTCR